MSSRRNVILVCATILIVALCAWRLANPRQRSVFDPNRVSDLRPAPSFQLHDQNSRVVKLDSYLHRHQIVLVFFDDKTGPEADSTLVELRNFYPALKDRNIIVLGVSTALPQQNRKPPNLPFPFPLLSDVLATDPNSAHRKWGRLIEPKSLDKPPGTAPAVFLIDRAGTVEWSGNAPKPVEDPSAIASFLLAE
jgi:peroxiredoxin